MSPAGGVLDAHPGRVTVRVARPPADLLDTVDLLAKERGADRAVILGDLVAAALPDALAEAARDLLAHAYNAETAPGLPDADPRPTLREAVAASVPPGSHRRKAGGDAE